MYENGVDGLNRQLTKSLLKRDFGLHIELPDDRLCPPVGRDPRGYYRRLACTECSFTQVPNR